MKVLTVAAMLSASLTAAPTFAQQQPAPKPAAPAQPAPKPAVPAPAPAPAAPAAAEPAPRPFPEGARIAYVDVQRIASESAEGKAANTRINALQQKRAAELAEKQKALQGDQQKLQSGGTVLSDQARVELERKIERQDVDIQRATQDAQKELQELTQSLQAEFQRKLFPVLDVVAREKGLHMLFSAADAGLVWGDNGLDLTIEVIKKFDTMPAAAAAPKPQ